MVFVIAVANSFLPCTEECPLIVLCRCGWLGFTLSESMDGRAFWFYCRLPNLHAFLAIVVNSI